MNTAITATRGWRSKCHHALTGAAIGATLLMAACQPQLPTAPTATLDTTATGSEIPEITIMAHDYSFSAPQEIEAGLVRVKFEDHGAEPHHLQFARINSA